VGLEEEKAVFGLNLVLESTQCQMTKTTSLTKSKARITISKYLNAKKPHELITDRILKEQPELGINYLTQHTLQLFNATAGYFSLQWKEIQIIMIPKPNKTRSTLGQPITDQSAYYSSYQNYSKNYFSKKLMLVIIKNRLIFNHGFCSMQ